MEFKNKLLQRLTPHANVTVDTIITLSDHMEVILQLNFNYAKIKRKLIRFRKKMSSFPVILMEAHDEIFHITQNYRHQPEFYL